MKLLVIGNGRTDIRNGIFFCNKHTGKLLESLKNSEKIELTYAQFAHKSIVNDNLTDYSLTDNNIKIVPLNFDYSNNLKVLNYCYFFVKLIILLLKHDVIYIFWPGRQGFFAGLLARSFGKKYGIYIRGDFPLNRYSNYIFRGASFCLSVSQYFTDKVLGLCHNIFPEPPLIDISLSDLYLERNEIDKPLSTFLFVGRIESAKGIAELIEAFEDLISNGHNVYLNLVGGGDMFEHFSKNVRSIDRIKFLGMVSDKMELINLYRRNDAFILPSHTEGFPRVIYEAMAAKAPIYTTFVGGIPYLMKDLQNCIELPLKDAKGLALRISETYQDLTLVNSISIKSLEEIRSILSQKKENHAQLLQKILSKINDPNQLKALLKV